MLSWVWVMSPTIMLMIGWIHFVNYYCTHTHTAGDVLLRAPRGGHGGRSVQALRVPGGLWEGETRLTNLIIALGVASFVLSCSGLFFWSLCLFPGFIWCSATEGEFWSFVLSFFCRDAIDVLCSFSFLVSFASSHLIHLRLGFFSGVTWGFAKRCFKISLGFFSGTGIVGTIKKGHITAVRFNLYAIYRRYDTPDCPIVLDERATDFGIWLKRWIVLLFLSSFVVAWD